MKKLQQIGSNYRLTPFGVKIIGLWDPSSLVKPFPKIYHQGDSRNREHLVERCQHSAAADSVSWFT